MTNRSYHLQDVYLISDDSFWLHVLKGDKDTCWPFTGYRMKNGYGQTGTYRFGTRYAHVIAFCLANNRKLTSHENVCHSCDNPICCNPWHLFAGNQSDNLQDMVAKGRSNKGARHWNSKLTPDQVQAIRDDPRPSEAVGILYGINGSTVRKIRRGERWSA